MNSYHRISHLSHMMNTNGQSVFAILKTDQDEVQLRRQSMTISRLIRNASEVIKYRIVNRLERILQTQDHGILKFKVLIKYNELTI